MYDSLKQDLKWNTPLHYACKYDNDTEPSVDLLFSIPNNNGRLPINIASEVNTNLIIIQKLYNQYPDSVYNLQMHIIPIIK